MVFQKLNFSVQEAFWHSKRLLFLLRKLSAVPGGCFFHSGSFREFPTTTFWVQVAFWYSRHPFFQTAELSGFRYQEIVR
jgi:hypothetical protein